MIILRFVGDRASSHCGENHRPSSTTTPTNTCPIKGVCNSIKVIAICEQKFDHHTEFIKQVLGHGGSYDDSLTIEMDHFSDKIFGHLPPLHQLPRVP